MATIFIDGFDKYGVAGIDANTLPTLISAMSGEWTSFGSGAASRIFLVAPLSASGQAINLGQAGGATLNKTLSANYARIIGGFRFKNDLLNGSNSSGIQFLDGATAQCTILFNTTGAVALRTGSNTGTILGTSSTTYTAGSINYLEWDITIGASSAYNIYLNGVSILSGTGATRTTANNQTNAISIGNFTASNAMTIVVDDFYLADNTGSAGITAVLLNSPRVETTLPTADSSVAFSFGAGVVGKAYSATINTNSPGANELFLTKFTAPANCTINTITTLPETTSGIAKFKAVIYSDSAGTPNTLLSSGTEVVGVTTGTLLTGSLVTPQSLTGGTSYWIGFITDTSIQLQEVDSTTLGQKASNTYGSGAPGTAPAMTAGQPTWMIYGNVTGVATNTPEVNLGYVTGVAGASFVQSSTAAQEDLYTFGTLSSTPATIYTVFVKAFVEKTDSGARTISLDTKSVATDSTGSSAGQALATSYQWQSSFFDTDPNTSAAWGASALNSAKSGQQVAS